MQQAVEMLQKAHALSSDGQCTHKCTTELAFIDRRPKPCIVDQLGPHRNCTRNRPAATPPQVSSQLHHVEQWIAPTQKQRTPEERRARKEHLRAYRSPGRPLVGPGRGW